MICSVIGCGTSATKWPGDGYSIGVNDCWKYGFITDRLIVVNSLTKFPERHRTVINSTPKDGLYSHLSIFNGHPNYIHIRSMQRWKGSLKPDILYYSSSSPFIALSMAHNMGFKEIVLWGVDFIQHPTIKGYGLIREVQQYVSFVKHLGKIGTNVYLGSSFGALQDVLPIWNG